MPKSYKPKWFTTLETIILDYTSTKVISNQFWLLSNNSLAYTTGHYSTRAKPWLITYLLPSTTVIVGKARRLFSEKNTVSITHWTLQPNFDSSNLYPYLNPTCFPCQGCNLNSKKVTGSCTFKISATLSTKFLGWKTYQELSNKLKLNANYLDLLYSIAFHNPPTIPLLPTLQITSSSITMIFNPSEATQQLETIYQKNYNQQQLVFYTDRSVINICTN